MVSLHGRLELPRCPHCNVDKPSLVRKADFKTTDHIGGNQRFWMAYACATCGGAVLASSQLESGVVIEIYPEGTSVHDVIPSPARDYLTQAVESLHSPAGSVMLSASAVDAMLKSKSYKKGTLYSRINKAAEDQLITAEMAAWAHDVRLDANDPRHSDEKKPLPSEADAKRCVEFTLALAEFLFVLPSRVERGRASIDPNEKSFVSK